MANLIFGGRKIGSSVLQFSAARGITSEIENTSHSVGISDGEMLINSRLKSRIIPVTYDFVALSRREFERQLAPLLYSTDVQKLIIDDRPDEFWYAKVDGKIDMDRAYFLGTGTINFLVPDGIAHSVATKTFDNMPYKDVPVNLLKGTSSNNTGVVKANAHGIDGITLKKAPVDGGQTYVYTITFGDMGHTGHSSVSWYDASNNWISSQAGPDIPWVSEGGRFSTVFMAPSNAAYVELTPRYFSQTFPTDTSVSWTHEKLELGTSASPWSPNPADAAYYSDTITVHNGGTYPVEPIITATMHADNGMVGIVNDRPGILQFGTQEIDGFTTEESEVALDLAAVQGSHMDNQAATNNPYWGGDPSMPNEQIGNAIWTHDDYDGWKVEPNWTSITGDHKYWNGPSIKHNLVQTHNGNFKSNLTWDVMTRFQTGVSKVGALETTLESDGKPIFQMILKDNSALSDQLWWMCYYKDQLVVNEQLDRSIFTNDKFIQLELQKFGNSVVFRVSPWVGNQGRETTITRQFTFADAADVETKQFSTWFMRDKTWGESTMYLIASTVKWQNVSWYTNIKNRLSNGDVLKIDVANAKTYLNGSLDPTMHTLGNQWEQFKLPPGDTKIAITPSSWAQPFACEVEIREAWL
ncbi:distal tail protein Dit [Lacticaseibacillus rhamnosus]|uniref:distal tail protein Dit n=1 Tax=Lacticaseibacillus rhamnosus TaxID=47715 RepID=UPI0021A7090F|nr:distal tail protein Dit [Lacticaseibacillus rhamnosus]MCT3168953.1 phage tail protein [Lacticaseibacillus rhamnosus]MCT3178439.1 phage tail protein [Lacticaseibacillus rhamnosus]MCT3183939.1 phage tail protein [Lacticaseibacillus rhamnosus]MCT4449529.1 phage tail protein [Lacticaseibacillus rhamnosus]